MKWVLSLGMRTNWLFAFALMSLCLILELLHPFNEFWDDSYISLHYARNMARGVGLVFLPQTQEVPTPYSYVEGYSNPLWTFLLALFFHLPGGPFPWVRVASFLSVGIIVLSLRGLLQNLVQEQRRRNLPAWILWLPGALAILNFPILAYVKSGMETVTFTAFVLLALWHSLSLLKDPRPALLLLNGLLWLTVSLIRPEGVVYAAAAGLVLGFRFALSEGRWREMLAWGMPIVLGLAAFYLWRYGYYGEWLPNTYYAKVERLQSAYGVSRTGIFRWGISHLQGFIRMDLPSITAASATVGIFLFRALRKESLLMLLTAAAFNSLYVIWVGGDFFPLSRFLQVTGCILMVFAAVPVAGLWQMRSCFARVGAGPVLAAALALSLVVFQPVWTRVHSWVSDRQKTWIEQSEQLLKGDHSNPAFFVGKWLKENLPVDTVIATGHCGMIPYYSNLETVDLLGLNDHHLARRLPDIQYLEERGVKVMVDVVTDRPSSPYQFMIRNEDVRREFIETHRLHGFNHHGNRVSFAVFTRRDAIALWYKPGPDRGETALSPVPREPVELELSASLVSDRDP